MNALHPEPLPTFAAPAAQFGEDKENSLAQNFGSIACMDRQPN
jgi:hypothetical protein